MGNGKEAERIQDLVYDHVDPTSVKAKNIKKTQGLGGGIKTAGNSLKICDREVSFAEQNVNA